MTGIRRGGRLLPLLAALFGFACQPPTAKQPKLSSRGRFGSVAPSARSPLLSSGAPSSTVIAVDAGVAGDRISGLLEIPKDDCAVIVGRAGASVEDVDLLAYGEDGSVVGTDEGPDKTPALLVCPPHPPRIWVAARIAAGHGLVAIGAERVAPADAGRAAAVYGIRSLADPNRVNVASWPGLAERLETHRREIGGSWQEVRRVAVPLEARLPTRVSAQIEAGRCLDAFVAPSDEVGHIELTATDENGAILGRSNGNGRERFLILCSPLDTNVAIELRPQSGRGYGVLSLGRARPGSETEIDADITRIDSFPQKETDAELTELDAQLTKHNAYSSKGKKVAAGSLEAGRRATIALTLPGGCSRLDVVGGRPTRGLEAWVWTTSGKLLSHGSSGGRVLLFVCVRAGAGSVRLDLESRLRPGPFAVLAHSEPEVPESLLASPLAAGRLLSQVVERGVLRRASEVGQALPFDLSDAEIKSLDLTVPFGRCVDVALALDADAVGAEVRLVAAATGAEIAIGRGAHTTSARVCSLDAGSARDNLKTRAELRVASGAGKALVATRMLSPTR